MDRDGVDDGVREFWLRPNHIQKKGERRNSSTTHEDARALSRGLMGRRGFAGFVNPCSRSPSNVSHQLARRA